MGSQWTKPAIAGSTRNVCRVDGARLHWCEIPCERASTRPPLLLLHGLNDSHLTWQRVAPGLARGRRVLMPDLLGFGLSDRPDASYTLTWHAEMMTKWLAQLGVRELDVVGHSFGGGLGQRLLLDPALRVRRLALLASGGLGRDIGFLLRLATVPMLEHFGQPFMEHGTRLVLRYMQSSLSAEDIEQLSLMNARPHTARAFARTLRDVVDWHGQRRMFSQHAHEIGAPPPLFVCWGDRDDLIPMAHGVAFAKSVPGAVFHCMRGAGHWLHHDQPDAVVRALRSFLHRTRAATAPVALPAACVSGNAWNVESPPRLQERASA